MCFSIFNIRTKLSHSLSLSKAIWGLPLGGNKQETLQDCRCPTRPPAEDKHPETRPGAHRSRKTNIYIYIITVECNRLLSYLLATNNEHFRKTSYSFHLHQFPLPGFVARLCRQGSDDPTSFGRNICFAVFSIHLQNFNHNHVALFKN